MHNLAVKFNINRRYANHDEYFTKCPLNETFGYIYLWALQLDIFRKYCKEWYLSGNYTTRTIDGVECAVIYVGQSINTNVLNREKQHVYSNETEFDEFINEIASEYDIDVVMPRIIIDHANSMEVLNLKEEYYIMRYNLFYDNNKFALNHQKGGGNYKPSKKAIEKRVATCERKRIIQEFVYKCKKGSYPSPYGGISVRCIETDELFLFKSVEDASAKSKETLGFYASHVLFYLRAKNDNGQGEKFKTGHVIKRGGKHYEILFGKDLLKKYGITKIR